MNCSTGPNPNKCNVNPLLKEVSSSAFTLDSGSPAIGYGLTKSYLPAQAVDVGPAIARLPLVHNVTWLGDTAPE